MSEQINDYDELAALPTTSVVLDPYGYARQKRGTHGYWYVVGDTGGRINVPYYPVVVLYRPDQEAANLRLRQDGTDAA